MADYLYVSHETVARFDRAHEALLRMNALSHLSDDDLMERITIENIEEFETFIESIPNYISDGHLAFYDDDYYYTREEIGAFKLRVSSLIEETKELHTKEKAKHVMLCLEKLNVPMISRGYVPISYHQVERVLGFVAQYSFPPILRTF